MSYIHLLFKFRRKKKVIGTYVNEILAYTCGCARHARDEGNLAARMPSRKASLPSAARGTIFAGEAGRYGQAKPGRYLPFARAQAHKTGLVPGILREKNHNKFLRNSFFLEIVIEGHFFRQQRLYNHQKPPHGLGQSMLYVYSFKMGL